MFAKGESVRSAELLFSLSSTGRDEVHKATNRAGAHVRCFQLIKHVVQPSSPSSSPSLLSYSPPLLERSSRSDGERGTLVLGIWHWGVQLCQRLLWGQQHCWWRGGERALCKSLQTTSYVWRHRELIVTVGTGQPWIGKIHLSKWHNVVFQITKSICLNCKQMYLLKCKMLSKLQNVVVPIAKYICSNCKMYFFKLPNVFGPIANHICPNCKMFLCRQNVTEM